MKSILSLILYVALATNIATASVIGDLDGDIWNIGANGHGDVTIGDQTTPTVILPLSKVNATTTLTAQETIYDTTIEVASATGFIDGAYIAITDAVNNRYYIGRQVGAIAGLVVSLNTPIDFSYPAGAQVTAGTTDWAVDGSVTPQIFSVRSGDVGIPAVGDITRIIFTCQTATQAELSDFGDIPGGLAKGIVLRAVNGVTFNVFTVTSNREMMGVMYDWDSITGKAGSGDHGFKGRLTFAGQSKMGVAIRIAADEDLELIVQDNLSTLISCEAMAEGHIVQPD